MSAFLLSKFYVALLSKNLLINSLIKNAGSKNNLELRTPNSNIFNYFVISLISAKKASISVLFFNNIALVTKSRFK